MGVWDCGDIGVDIERRGVLLLMSIMLKIIIDLGSSTNVDTCSITFLKA